MEFKTNDNPWVIGLPIHDAYSFLELKAFQLISIFNASSRNHKVLEISTFLANRHYEHSEISRLLIEIAAEIRNAIDLGYGDFGITKYHTNSSVGKLTNDINVNPKVKIELSFREACNKILHCKHINFDLVKPKNLYVYNRMNPIIYLYGDFREKEWKAKLDIIKFIVVLLDIKN